jgi:uncharacterized membrane protein
MSNTTSQIIGILVTAVGVSTLINPGGLDMLSALNIWMGGLLIGLSLFRAQ